MMRVALVTGGSKGLGKAVVEKLLEEGVNVAFTYFRDEITAQELVKTYAGQVLAIKSDAAEPLEASRVIDEVIEKFGQIDILINNVYGAKDAAVVNHTFDMLEFTMKHTFYPAYHYTMAVTPYMIKQMGGRIINIGSINGLRGREGSLAYASAKSALTGFTKTIAKELGKYNIFCNIVAPGYIETDGQKYTSELIKKMVLDESAIKKLPKPEEIANLIAFLVLQDSGNITGEIFKIDCGQYI